MSTQQRAASPWWEPTWRRLIASTVVLFVVILAFLVGRVRAGVDPGLARTATPVPQSAPPAASQPQQQQPQQGTDPSIDPSQGGGTDNFGNAVPDQSGGTQGFDPPSTHVS
jgi:hypothetical protein